MCIRDRSISGLARTLKKEEDIHGFHLIRGKNVARIPFELHSNLIVVPVKINVSDTLRFILDTGVSSMMLTLSLIHI